MKKAIQKDKGPTEVVLLGEGGDLEEESVEGVSEEALAAWLRSLDPKEGSGRMWMSQVSGSKRPLGVGPVPGFDGREPRPSRGGAPSFGGVAGPPPGKLPTFLATEAAERLGIRHLYEMVHALDGCVFDPSPSYPKVGVLGQRVVCAAAEVVVRLYPREMAGVDTGDLEVAIHVLDSFFTSRLGRNFEAPCRKLLRHGLILTRDMLTLGTVRRQEAVVCVEAVRFTVSSLLALI